MKKSYDDIDEYIADLKAENEALKARLGAKD